MEKSTRDAKRNLLLVSVAIITIKAFNVTVEKIPLGGLSINFDPGALGFLLAGALLYFFVTFLLYFYIDVRNLEVTKHQQEHAKQSREAPTRYNSKLNHIVAERIEGILATGQSLATAMSGPPEVTKSVRPTQIFGGRPRLVVVEISQTKGNSYSTLVRADDPALFENIDDLIAQTTRTFWWRIKANELWHRVSSLRVAWTYRFRIFFVDGVFPALLALYALAALFNFVSLDWIRSYSPTLKTTSVIVK
ncbi:hypothetical protein GGD67_005418 [Bradyrhizobium sp. IAR9]|uniref:hypothetical protein n=1 Tax=Bradyrhizobium sp. IAR9 TaxID=2663841 RepID=UPI0015C6BB09|nr:hypothetical protein [Bradyrhizobium sp. IAR9]NYG47935.1 hypothetical protein [Bradyrhizobium sp. IAR9]